MARPKVKIVYMWGQLDVGQGLQQVSNILYLIKNHLLCLPLVTDLDLPLMQSNGKMWLHLQIFKPTTDSAYTKNLIRWLMFICSLMVVRQW